LSQRHGIRPLNRRVLVIPRRDPAESAPLGGKALCRAEQASGGAGPAMPALFHLDGAGGGVLSAVRPRAAAAVAEVPRILRSPAGVGLRYLRTSRHPGDGSVLVCADCQAQAQRISGVPVRPAGLAPPE